MRIAVAAAVLLATTTASGLTAEDIIARLDDNTSVRTTSYEATMTISLGGQVREKSFRGYGEGSERAYFEFTAPVRDRNTRFLKLGDEMWMWIPRVGKSTKLSGHMLRQSMMGSDFSYSDASRNARLLDQYDVELLGPDTLDGRDVVVVDLVAKTDEVDYARQKAWVDTVDFVPRKVEYYAASGKLLKEMRVDEFRPIAGRNYPTRVKMTNLLRADTYTVMQFTDIRLDVSLPAEVFTTSHLER